MSDSDTTQLEQLQLDIVARLRSSEQFCNRIPVILYKKRLVQTELDRKLAVGLTKGGKVGLAIIVSMPLLDIENANVLQGDIKPVIQVLEAPLFNNSKRGHQVSAESIVWELIPLLNCWSTGQSIITIDEGREAEPVSGEINDCLVGGYSIYFKAHAIIPRNAKVGIPVVNVVDLGNDTGTGATHEATVTSAPAGAEIYYTTCGAYPQPGANETKAWTAGTISLSTYEGDTRLRMIAVKDGADASDIVEVAIS